MAKIYLSQKGLKPGIDNSKIINRQIEIGKEGSTIVFPDYTVGISQTIIQNKTLHWEGQEATNIEAMVPLTFARFTGGYKAVINRIWFIGFHTIRDKTDPTFDSIVVNCPLYMRECTIMNGWGNGITVQASHPKDASCGEYVNINIGQCKGHGMYFQGADANCNKVDHADIRDCDGIGIWDNAFLMNYFSICITHANAGGSFKVGNEKDPDNQNSRTLLNACYAEGGQPIVIICGHSLWVGGLAANGIDNRNFAEYHTS